MIHYYSSAFKSSFHLRTNGPLTRVMILFKRSTSNNPTGADSVEQLQLSVIVSKLKLLSAFRHSHLCAGEAVKRVSEQFLSHSCIFGQDC